jgi:hypothetical protein
MNKKAFVQFCSRHKIFTQTRLEDFIRGTETLTQMRLKWGKWSRETKMRLIGQERYRNTHKQLFDKMNTYLREDTDTDSLMLAYRVIIRDSDLWD